MSDQLNWKSATKLVRGFAKRKFSPVEVAEACLAQIGRHDASINAICGLHAEAALVQAKASETRWMKGKPLGPVDGVPVLVKDLLLVKGWKTLRGSKTVDPDQPWDNDAPSVARLRRRDSPRGATGGGSRTGFDHHHRRDECAALTRPVARDPEVELDGSALRVQARQLGQARNGVIGPAAEGCPDPGLERVVARELRPRLGLLPCLVQAERLAKVDGLPIDTNSEVERERRITGPGLQALGDDARGLAARRGGDSGDGATHNERQGSNDEGCSHACGHNRTVAARRLPAPLEQSAARYTLGSNGDLS